MDSSGNFRTGWWMNNVDRSTKYCYELLEANLNGDYKPNCCDNGNQWPMYEGIVWKSWEGEYTSLQASEMSLF